MDFEVNYQVTDDQLIEFGISKRIIDLSRQPFMRKGQIDFDIPYALAILDAHDNVMLASLAINNPHKNVHYPPQNPIMGLVRTI